MYGQNPKRPPEKGDGSHLQIQHMFPTFQGEGPFIGMPAVFIRLGGCNLACSFCDTEFESFTEMQTADVIAKAVALRPHPARRVHGAPKEIIAVITGGEPFRQAIGPLCEQLIAEGFYPQIETNGTLYRDIPDGVSIVCSPKNNSGAGYFPPHPDIRRRVSAYKFLISAEDDGYHTVPDWLSDEHAPVYVQPIDTEDTEKNRKNYLRTADVAEEHGLILGIQMHKYYGIE